MALPFQNSGSTVWAPISSSKYASHHECHPECPCLCPTNPPMSATSISWRRPKLRSQGSLARKEGTPPLEQALWDEQCCGVP